MDIINIAGFLAGLVIGVIAIIVGVSNGQVWAIAFGVWALGSVVLAWFSGAKAAPGGNPFKQKLEAVFKNVPDGAWWIIAIGLVIVLIVAFIFR
jgi:hypothetical protein